MDYLWGIIGDSVDLVDVLCFAGAVVIVAGLFLFDRRPAPTPITQPAAPQRAPGTVIATYTDGSREIVGLHRNFIISADGRTVTPLD